MNDIQVENVTKIFSTGSKENKVIEGINLRIEKNEFICIVGLSGCGKTTLMRIMAGFEKPTTGDVFYNGEKITKPKMKCAFFFQDFNQLFPWKTAKKNVVYPLMLNKYGNRRECERKAEEYLELVNIRNNKRVNKKDNIWSRFPCTLSGGEKQRVTLARTLAMQPDVLFMDEPFSSLDAMTREDLQNELRKIWRELKLTIIFVTHNLDEAIRLSTRIIVLGNECGEEHDNPAKIFNDITNNVSGKRMPTDAGYSELWNELNKSIKACRDKNQ